MFTMTQPSVLFFPTLTPIHILGYVTLLVILLSFLYIFYTCIYKPVRYMYYYSSQNMSGTRYVPLVGDLPMFIQNRKNKVPFDEWFLHYDNQFGKLYYMFLGPEFRLRIANPKIIQQILIKYSSSFQKPRLMRNVMGLLLGNGLLLSEGKIHTHHRLLINPAFQFNKLKSMTPLMLNAAQKHVQDIWLGNTAVSSDADRKFIDIHEALSALTLEIIAQAAFGTYTTTESAVSVSSSSVTVIPTVDSHVMYESLAFLLTSIVSNVQNLGAFIPGYMALPLPKNRKIRNEVKNIRSLLSTIIQQRKQLRKVKTSTTEDLLIDHLLDAQTTNNTKDNSNVNTTTANYFSDEDVLDEAITFITAGHETTSQALSWVLYCLAKHPEWKHQLVNQINDLLPNKQVPTYDDINKLPLLSYILWETMRLFPPAPIVAREAIENVNIEYTDGIESSSSTVTKHLSIRKGTALVISVSSLHRDPDIWSDPHNFHPERWSNGYSQTLRHPCAYIPFSMGDRNCIGERFAVQEAKLILIILLQHMDFELDPSYIHFPTMAITLRPGYGMPMRIWRRG